MCRARREMTRRERLSLSTWQKWKKYGRIPWKLIFNLLLAITTTSIIVIQSVDEAPYSRASLSTWQFLLQPKQNTEYTGALTQYGYKTVWYIYKVKTLLSTIRNTVDVYFNVNNLTVDRFDYVKVNTIAYNGSEHYVPQNLTLSVERYAKGQAIFDLTSDFDDDTVTESYSLSESWLGPFEKNGTALTQYVHTIKSAKISLVVQNYEFHPGYRTCFEWTIRVLYDFTFRGRIDMSVEMSQDLCPQEKNVSWWQRTDSLVVSLYFVNLFLAFVSQALHLKAVVRSILIYQEVKRAAFDNSYVSSSPLAGLTPVLRHRLSWHHLGWREKLRFFNMWFFTATISNVCNVVSASMSLHGLAELSGATYSRSLSIVTGLGCMFTWISLVQYFESTTSYYVLITTLTSGTPKVARFLVGVMPVFLGYAMFGVALFSSTTPRFATVDQACVTLFALLNGDVIHDVFDELYPAQPIISRIYLYTFISLFIYAVLNIFIAIVEDAFFASKAFQKQQQKHLKEIGIEKMDPLDLIDMVLPPDVHPIDDGEDDDDSPQFHDPRGGGGSSDGGDGEGGVGEASDSVWQSSKAWVKSSAKKKQQRKVSQNRKKSQSSTVAKRPLLDTPLLNVMDAFSDDDDIDDQVGGETGVRNLSVQISSGDNVALDATLDMLRALQKTFNNEFLQYVEMVINDKRNSSLLVDRPLHLRPPHDNTYYPCGDRSCIYCGIRRIYEGAVKSIQTELPVFLDRVASN